jgi:hypothetical protein
MLEKAGFCGITALISGIPWLGLGSAGWVVPMTSLTIPVEFLTFGMGTANSFIADGVHMFLNKGVPLGKKTADRTALISNAVVAGLSMFTILHLAGANVPQQVGFFPSFIIGSVSEVVGSASYEYLANNLYF